MSAPAGLTHRHLLVAGLALLGIGLYLGLAAAGSQPGFPLDDAWIHQTYARNLASSGRWEYTPGAVSAGSTAPLWTLLLAVGYLLRLPYLAWAYLLGWLALVWLAWAGMAVWRHWWPGQADKAWLAGAVLILTWPLVWAAASGMETALFIALGLHVLALYGRLVGETTAAGEPHSRSRALLAGFLAGLLVLARPDGLALLALVFAGLLVAARFRPGDWRLVAGFAVAAALPLLPYFTFNLRAGGAWWPNTFYAKQAEYAFLWKQPLPLRFGQLLFFTLGGPDEGLRGVSGAHLLLLPGLVAAAWQAARRDWAGRRLRAMLPLLWAAGHVFLFAWRLPVTYQHGRYLWVALPVWILYGLAGSLRLSDNFTARLATLGQAGFIWRTASRLTFAVLLLAFLFLGGAAYAQDVAFINGEMVAVAHWLRDNTPAGALVAAHDIGAIGYFAGRPLLDLAGLISPEVVPLLADEPALAAYVRQSPADYLVTAPGWTYPSLTTVGDVELLYQTDFAGTRKEGFNNMAVYHLDRR
ncbi:MAG: hypothetical protein L0332_09995 [Chloroflexi bacterium]|nr:hypothetical protein [Chloroflexota bacterium]MCI0578880.1 hypothetical protein [Chloroflexota bacterium]MCI0649121.1 hypothetical protein [Chloroflexota bacterium]MCI0727036.1 hypothetical protein [Chloroflexota bacterium]